MKRILCFSAYATANLRATALINGLRDAGYEVIVPRAYGPSGHVAELLLSFLPHCWMALFTHRVDLVVGFKGHPNVTAPLWLCKLRGIATWLDVDDLDHGYRDSWLSRVIELYEKPFPRWFDIVSYHNTKLAGYLTGAMRCRAEQLLPVPQGVYFDRFHDAPPAAATQQLRERLGLTGKRVAIYTAHLNLASDLEPVLDAWQQVAARLPDAVLLVVGGGPRLAEFEQRVATMRLTGRVVFTGEVTHRDMRAHMALADVALLYFSRRLVNEYRCSLKLREYFAAGLKIVCNDVGELPEFAKLTYQSGSDPAAFAGQIVEVFEGRTDGREAIAQQFARDHLDWAQIVAAVEPEIRRRVDRVKTGV